MDKIERNQKGQFIRGFVSKYRHIPIVGKKYNLLEVISEDVKKSNDNKTMFNVRCECGKEMYIRSYFLESGRQKGCKKCASKYAYHKSKEEGKMIGFVKLAHEGVGDITKTYYGHLKSNAKVRNKNWNTEITIQFLWDLFLKQDKKCALSGLDITMSSLRKNSNANFDYISASLDRIDNDRDYEPDNIQWVHKDVNRLKWAFSQEKLFELCKLIYNKNMTTMSQDL